MDHVKAHPIVITRGSYAGKPAWRNLEKGSTAKMVYVYVETGGSIITTRLLKDQIETYEKPSNRAEATVLQHADILVMMDKLALTIAKCMEKPDDQQVTEFAEVFAKKIMAATSKLKSKGHLAEYRKVNFKDPEEQKESAIAKELAEMREKLAAAERDKSNWRNTIAGTSKTAVANKRLATGKTAADSCVTEVMENS